LEKERKSTIFFSCISLARTAIRLRAGKRAGAAIDRYLQKKED